MTVTLLRHGTAEESAYRDWERALTHAGRQEVRDIGEALRQAVPLPDVVVCSPLVRAVQTAELLVAALGYRGSVLVDRALCPDGAAERILDLLVSLAARPAAAASTVPDEARRTGEPAAGPDRALNVAVAVTGVALVAHEPLLSSVCQLLLGRPVAGLRRAEAICLDWESGSMRPARLLWKGCPS